MALELTLPFGKRGNIKNLVFSILTYNYPLKLIELTNYIKKRYGRDVTFQAVRKAVLQLVEESVLIKKNNEFLINKQWVFDAKKTIDQLFTQLNQEDVTPKDMDSVSGEISVFTFESPNELMKFWQMLIDDWFKKFKKNDPNLNVYQGVHIWECLLHPDSEKKIMGQLKKKGIISYSLSAGYTPLDNYCIKFYKNIGANVAAMRLKKSFDKKYYVATYGELIVQPQYPDEVIEKMEEFFKKNKTLEDMNIKDLIDILNLKIKTKLTIIKNLEMAKQINKSIIKEITNQQY